MYYHVISKGMSHTFSDTTAQIN